MTAVDTDRLYEAFHLWRGRRPLPGQEELGRLLPGDAAAQRRLLRMLALESQAGDDHADALADARDLHVADALDALALGPTLVPGTRVGGWSVVAQVGQGGTARVYRVRRDGDGFAQEGALKLIAHRAGEPLRLARERRLLASLRHPCIARLLDGGGSADHSWLVMELVDGVPLDAFLTARTPTLAQRVAMLVEIADALAHAHRQLVVHRDLKPSNVLVQADRRVRLIDFGIARQLDDGDAATATGNAMLTLRYAAPEQLRGQPPSVAMDVYSFGVVAHEVLCGSHPFAAAQQYGLAERVAGQPPPAMGEAAGHAARLRVPADLRAIVARCLRGEPAERYAGADAVRDDLQRWSRGEPVLARAGQRGYRMRRLLARHWLGLAGAAALVLGLSAATVVSLEQAREAERARRGTAQVAGFLSGVLGDLDPSGEGNARRDVTLDEVLELGYRRLQQTALGIPERARLLLDLANGLTSLGRLERSAAMAREAEALLLAEDATATEPVQAMLLEARLLSANALRHTDAAAAAAVYQRLRADIERSGASPLHEARVLQAQAELLMDTGSAGQARPLLERATDLLDGGDGGAPTALQLQVLAALVRAVGEDDPAAALPLSARHLALVAARFGEQHEAFATALANHAVRLEHAGDNAASGALQERAWQILTSTVGADHPNAESIAANYAIWLQRNGDHQRAAVMQQHLIAARSARYGPRAASTAAAWQNRATTLHALGRLQEADAHARNAQEIYDQVMPPDSYLPALPRLTRSRIALDQGRASAAAQLAIDARTRLLATLGADSMPAQVAQLRLGAAERALGECVRGSARIGAARDALRDVAHAAVASYLEEAGTALASECDAQ